ncbi:MAG: cysteine-rich CWC family protein [Ottowia sp.]|nr:cysteine-rich CWC family protein [Ottowia sp.]
MYAQSPPVDPARCPLCGGSNGCSMEQARATGQAPAPCWCMQASFAPELLDRVPAAARRMACICARCAAQAAPEADPRA